jgi:hypothetical protein
MVRLAAIWSAALARPAAIAKGMSRARASAMAMPCSASRQLAQNNMELRCPSLARATRAIMPLTAAAGDAQATIGAGAGFGGQLNAIVRTAAR